MECLSKIATLCCPAPSSSDELSAWQRFDLMVAERDQRQREQATRAREEDDEKARRLQESRERHLKFQEQKRIDLEAIRAEREWREQQEAREMGEAFFAKHGAPVTNGVTNGPGGGWTTTSGRGENVISSSNQGWTTNGNGALEDDLPMFTGTHPLFKHLLHHRNCMK